MKRPTPGALDRVAAAAQATATDAERAAGQLTLADVTFTWKHSIGDASKHATVKKFMYAEDETLMKMLRANSRIILDQCAARFGASPNSENFGDLQDAMYVHQHVTANMHASRASRS
jgi:hypothetical protein